MSLKSSLTISIYQGLKKKQSSHALLDVFRSLSSAESIEYFHVQLGEGEHGNRIPPGSLFRQVGRCEKTE